MKNWWLYVLKLEQGKYYVGITTKTPELRMKEHIDGIRAAYWTQKYKPIELFYTENLGHITKETAEYIENLITRKYMRQYGLNNVRGGDLTKTEDYSRISCYIYMKRDVVFLRIILVQLAAIALLLCLLMESSS